MQARSQDDTTGLFPRDGASPAVGASPDRFATGEIVGGIYEVRGVLGRGGMSVVYEAHDRLMGRDVALKVSQDADGQRWLRQEAQALAAVRHPSLVTVYALGIHRGVEYLVMERVLGRTLDTLVDERRSQGGLLLLDALDLLVGVADALRVVHEAGLSHRDVKPNNVMLAPGDRVVLLDFGLVCPEYLHLDRIVGSPEYMAPEVIQGLVRRGEGHLVDVYAFGVLAWELLAGRPPFMADAYLEVFNQHLYEPPPDLRARRPDVPVELASLVGELLAKQPSDRPQRIEAALWQLRTMAARLRAERGSHLEVLIADDDPYVTELMHTVVTLAAPNARVSHAADGEAALALVSRGVPDLLLLDVNMPRMNGLELCMYLRGSKLAERCRIVSVSGTATARDVALLRRLGIDEFIPKGEGLARRLAAFVRGLRPTS